jgi:glycosyltransferase involved in cell wall biosynthesis
LRYVRDPDLPALYAGADLYVQTSVYEGFGFPPLEAMACGTPVLSSTGGSLAEVLGGGACLLNNFDAELWAAEALRLLGDRAHRDRLAARGRAHAAAYSWADTARHTWDVYRSLCT